MQGQAQLIRPGRQKWLRRVGWILGVVAAVVAMPTSFLSCVAAFQLPWSLEVGYVAFAWLAHWIFLLVARKWQLVGGVLLILDSLLTAVFLFPRHQWSGGNVLSVLFLSVFLLLLASGTLFILSWREGSKQGKAQ